MDAGLFFELEAAQAIPLYCISSQQWDAEADSIVLSARHYFTLRQFSGRLGDYCCVHNAQGMIEKAYIGSGVGNNELALAHAALLLPPGTYQVQGTLSPRAIDAWALAQYRFTEYKKQALMPRKLVINDSELKNSRALVNAIYLVRDLINKPANAMGPQDMAELVEELANRHGAAFEQWVGDELLEANFPAVHAVGRASVSAPRLLSLTWGSAQHPCITLVGKGVCFDSGGLDIKPASNMRLMKKDMGGAAQVIGLAQWIMERALPIRLHVLIPAVENAIGPDAFRPGDVLTMRNGLSVEIDNTDAEGRLILADALVKACESKPDVLINFATLTGAARTAVGTEIAAFFCNDEALASELITSANEVGDPVWRLPLFSAYEELLSSSIADLVNSSPSPYAGAIVAGLFLQRFVDSSIPWLHFDVMAWNVGSKPGKPEGGEAMGLRAVAEYLLRTYA